MSDILLLLVSDRFKLLLINKYIIKVYLDGQFKIFVKVFSKLYRLRYNLS